MSTEKLEAMVAHMSAQIAALKHDHAAEIERLRDLLQAGPYPDTKQTARDFLASAQPAAPARTECPIHESGCSCVPQVIRDMKDAVRTEAEQAVLDACAKTGPIREWASEVWRAERARREAAE